MDKTPTMGKKLASWYQSLISMLSWMVEIGRFNIITEVSMMASQISMHKEGCLESVVRVFAFISQKYNSRMLFDPTYFAIDMIYFKECKWKDLYGEIK